MTKISIFWQKPWTNPFGKFRFFFVFSKLPFSGLKRIFLSRIIKKTIFPVLICPKNTDDKKVDFFTKTIDLPLWKISIFCTFLKLSFSGPKRILFYPEHQKTIFSCLICPPKNIVHDKKLDFWQNPWTNPFGKFRFTGVF